MNDHSADTFLGLPPSAEDVADVVILPVPLERTVSYGKGTGEAPRAILVASRQVETFDEVTGTDLAEGLRIHTARPVAQGDDIRRCLDEISERVSGIKEKFVLALGGEHTLTYAVVSALIEGYPHPTVVQIDAHADLADQLDGRRWSHGTVMRRLWEEGCRILQVGVRSLSRAEYELIDSGDRIRTHFAHQLDEQWPAVLEEIRKLTGDVYLSVDVDGLDPCVVPSTGTPEPGGLTWQQIMELICALTAADRCRLIGADIVEYVPSPHPPGGDLTVAKLAMRTLAFLWAAGKF